MALVVADWAFARWPTLLPGLTVDQAAAPHDTMVAVVVAVLAGAVLLFPALALLFTLTLRGHLGAHREESEPVAPAGQSGVAQLLLGPTLGARLAVALLIVGIGLLNVADAPWAHAIGVVSLLAFISRRSRRSCPGRWPRTPEHQAPRLSPGTVPLADASTPRHEQTRCHAISRCSTSPSSGAIHEEPTPLNTTLAPVLASSTRHQTAGDRHAPDACDGIDRKPPRGGG